MLVERHDYETVSQAIHDLALRGYTTDFKLEPEKDKIVDIDRSLELSPEEFEIDEIYRFEGMTDPGDEMIVYAISSLDHKTKGVLVNAFGTYSDANTYNIVKRLNKHL
ncbi:phosphoribosylpyrophosphate synthetase [Salegentibacter sp. JZCK2]|uniref:phosphoribosylpyrophosphate synthetase n=1 Tax=Salegentibacter tibetensis TaxID=2873600 RepID=UPI001CCD8A23|nr:phosphoribosylpyrophosphate synthetase [Salegentibacter tibetensis]MBZ9730959.1 phosphoribosylpyrophosphate synthetase [Salegentibacter tibetensis]